MNSNPKHQNCKREKKQKETSRQYIVEFIENKLGFHEFVSTVHVEDLISATSLDRLLSQPINRDHISKAITACRGVIERCDLKMEDTECEALHQFHLATKLRFMHSMAWLYGVLGQHDLEEEYYQSELMAFKALISFNPFFHLMCVSPLNELAKSATGLHYNDESLQRANNYLHESYEHTKAFTLHCKTVPPGFISTLCSSTGKSEEVQRTAKHRAFTTANTNYMLSLHLKTRYLALMKDFKSAFETGLKALTRQINVKPDDFDQVLWASAALEFVEICLQVNALAQANYLVGAAIQVLARAEDEIRPKNCCDDTRFTLSMHNYRRLTKRLKGHIEVFKIFIAVWVLEKRYQLSQDPNQTVELLKTVETYRFPDDKETEIKPASALPNYIDLKQAEFKELNRSAKAWMRLAKRILTPAQQRAVRVHDLQGRLDKIATMRI